MKQSKRSLLSLGLILIGSVAHTQSSSESPARSLTFSFASASSSTTAESDKTQDLSVTYSEAWESGLNESWRLTGSRIDSLPPIASAFRDADQLSFQYSRSVALDAPGRRAGFDVTIGYSDFYEDLAGPITTGNRRTFSLGANLQQVFLVDSQSAVTIKAGVRVTYFDENSTEGDSSDTSESASLDVSYGRLLGANGMIGAIGLSAVTSSESINLAGDNNSVDASIALRIPLGQDQSHFVELSTSADMTGDNFSAEKYSISWTRKF